MKIGILGSGTVGQQLGFGFLQSGHQVKIGTRDPSKLTDWQKKAGQQSSVGSFAETAAFGDLIVLATKWSGAEQVLQMAGKENFNGKVVIDATNPLKFETQGQPPTLAVAYPDSAGALIQKWLPAAKVVKCFNIVSSYLMVNPPTDGGKPDMFMAGNDPAAKQTVADIAGSWGWDVHDLGGIEQAYLLEALAMIWINYGFQHNHWTHLFKLSGK